MSGEGMEVLIVGSSPIDGRPGIVATVVGLGSTREVSFDSRAGVCGVCAAEFARWALSSELMVVKFELGPSHARLFCQAEKDLLAKLGPMIERFAHTPGDLSCHAGESAFVPRRDADRMAAAITVAIAAKELDQRSQAADALLDYCDGVPMSTARAREILFPC